jgi:hypothetical protein
MSLKTIKKGEVLYNEGDKITSVYLIQSGAVSLCLTRNKKNIDMFQVGSSQILGELVLLGQNAHNTSAVATVETKVLEIAVDAFKAQVEASPQMFKIIMKSLSDRLKNATAEVRSNRMEKDLNPCPDDAIAKVFGVIFHTANHKGEKKEGRVVVDWPLYRQYAQRIFGESLKRLENATNLLVKMKLAMYEMGKNPEDPEAPEEIQRVHFFDLSVIENFFEFFQYYYFKAGRSEIIKLEETVVNMLGGILHCAQGLPVDRYGIVSVEFPKLVEHFKNELNLNFSPDQIARLETKGLMMKRRTTATNEVLMQFELKEFTSIHKNWSILREVNKWNEKGSVDPYEVEKKVSKKTGGGTKCPACAADVAENQKFCGECGPKVAAAA